MNNAIFTICAKNYIGLALVLEKSVKEYNPNCDFFIFVADELPTRDFHTLPKNVIASRKVLNYLLTDDKWEEMAFKYSLTEFCTSIKPFCFQYIFDNLNLEKAIYLDPDILTFSSFDNIFNQLDNVNIILTPHITTFYKEFYGERAEKGLLSTGVYNLGFIALKNSNPSLGMLTWWGERLKDECYIEPLDSYFTDQRWMDFLPCFFGSEDLLVSKHLGLNVAPWNFFEREVSFKDDKWFVIHRKSDLQAYVECPLVFVHFSGYDYKSLIQGKVLQNNIEGLRHYPDIDIICQKYADFLHQEIETFNSFIDHKYTYGSFDNGISITNFQRRMFRGLLDEGCELHNPFLTEGASFYKLMVNKKLIELEVSALVVDKVNKLNLVGTTSKLRKINCIMRVLFKAIGLKNYTLLLRLLRPYSKVENHLHLLDSKYSDRLK